VVAPCLWLSRLGAIRRRAAAGLSVLVSDIKLYLRLEDHIWGSVTQFKYRRGHPDRQSVLPGRQAGRCRGAQNAPFGQAEVGQVAISSRRQSGSSGTRCASIDHEAWPPSRAAFTSRIGRRRCVSPPTCWASKA